MNKNKYPTPFELYEVINSFANREFVNRFSQSKGLFYINARQDMVAKEMSNILFEASDLDELRKIAYSSTSSHSLSGFVVKSSNEDFSLKLLYERMRDYGQTTLKGYSLNTLVKVDRNGVESFKGSLKYIKKRAGRIQFLEEEPSYAEFYLNELTKGEWQVEVDGSRSSDGKEIISLFSNVVEHSHADFYLLEIDNLNKKDTITFFDRLAKEGLNTHWRFVDVKQLTFRRRKPTKANENDETEPDTDTEELDESQLTGISQAILEGKNLRENPFVKKSEESGYIFTAMSYEFENKTTPDTIQIRAEFKGSPKIFEVTITSSEKNEGIPPKRTPFILDQKVNMEIRSEFWNNAKKVFNELSNK